MARPRDVSFRIVARDFTRGAFRSIGRSVRRLRQAVFSLNTLLLGLAGSAFVRFTTATANARRTVVQFADGLNIPVRIARLLELAFQNVGGNIRDADDAIGQLSAQLDRLRTGAAGAQDVEDAFRSLGASTEQIRRFTEDPFAALEFVIDKAAEFGRNPQALAALNRLVGEEGARQVRAISAEYGSLAEAIPRLADQLGTEEDIRAQAAAAEQLARSYERLADALTTLAVEGGVLDTLTQIVERLAQASDRAAESAGAFRDVTGGQAPVTPEFVLGFLQESFSRLVSSSEETAVNTRERGFQ